MKPNALLSLGIVTGLAVLLGRKTTEEQATEAGLAVGGSPKEEDVGGPIQGPVETPEILPNTSPAILAPGPVVTDTTPATRYSEREDLLGGGIPPVYNPPSNAVTPPQPAVADVRIDSFTVSPPKVKSGEIFWFSVTLHNYGDAPLRVRLQGALGVQNLLRQWTMEARTVSETWATISPFEVRQLTLVTQIPLGLTPKGYGARVWLQDIDFRELGSSRVIGEAVLVQPGAEGVR